MKYDLNDYDIFVTDIFGLNYYGINVFFRVCGTTEKTVFLVELGTKRYKNGVTLKKGLKTAEKPCIIVNNNKYTKSTYEVKPTKKGLPIKITEDLPIYKMAQERTEYPLTGTFYAVHIHDIVNKYWVDDWKKEEKLGGYA